MEIFRVDTSKIFDWDSFHIYFKTMFGFPENYGDNMIDWVDCMAALDDPATGMTQTNIKKGEVVVLNLINIDQFKRNCRELLEVLTECVAFINMQNLERGIKTMITLSYK